MLIAGCDPGLAGALCFLDSEAMRVVAVVDMPTLVVGRGSSGKKREISARSLLLRLSAPSAIRPL